MKIYTNDTMMKEILLDLLPGCQINKHELEYDLALINSDHTALIHNFKNMYSYTTKSLSNKAYRKVLLNKIRLIANKYNQEYVNDILDEIIGME